MIILLKQTTDFSRPGYVGNLLLRECGHQEWVYVESLGGIPQVTDRLQAESELPCTTCRNGKEREAMIGHLHTLGYASPGSLEQLEALMLDPDARLFDIRYSPRSRLPEWRREALEAKYGHRYQHVQSLGNVAYKNKGKEPIKLANPDEGIPYLISYLEAGYNLIILCACKNENTCHRKVVYDLVQKEMSKV